MKHIIEFRMPKFLESRLPKLSNEEKTKANAFVKTYGPLVLGVSVVYLVGYNRGLKKAVSNRGVYIIQSGR